MNEKNNIIFNETTSGDKYDEGDMMRRREGDFLLQSIF